MPLAIDATLHGDRVTALVVSVLYRGRAIPVDWHILPANQEGRGCRRFSASYITATQRFQR